jgi:hypothetical protein
MRAEPVVELELLAFHHRRALSLRLLPFLITANFGVPALGNPMILTLSTIITNKMGTKELLEFEANGYIEGRNIAPPASLMPTRRGHNKETITVELDSNLVYVVRNLFGYNKESINLFIANALYNDLRDAKVAV